ncbi:hypothetical protein ES703_58752 [subsurface metagenome]
MDIPVKMVCRECGKIVEILASETDRPENELRCLLCNGQLIAWIIKDMYQNSYPL